MEAEEAQRLGNPLLLRRALDHGVKVIVAHCASLGENPDLDAPRAHRPWRSNFDLFLRLVDDSRYSNSLYGDLSATGLVHRLSKPLITMLKRSDLHHRLLHASDYPVCAIHALVHTRPFVNHDLITEDECSALDELFARNPTQFDFVLKRVLRVTHHGEVHGFADSVFRASTEVFSRLRPR